jgi:hypothetical protein
MTPAMQAEIIAALAAPGGQPQAALDALGRLAEQVSGARLVTLTTCDPVTGEAGRVYTNMPGPYPLKGRKQTEPNRWTRIVIEGHQTFVANTIEEIAGVFPDHELIASLGCGSVVNLPAILGGQVLGTVNCLDAAGYFTPERVAAVESLTLAAQAVFILNHQMTGGQS